MLLGRWRVVGCTKGGRAVEPDTAVSDPASTTHFFYVTYPYPYMYALIFREYGRYRRLGSFCRSLKKTAKILYFSARA